MNLVLEYMWCLCSSARCWCATLLNGIVSTQPCLACVFVLFACVCTFSGLPAQQWYDGAQPFGMVLYHGNRDPPNISSSILGPTCLRPSWEMIPLNASDWRQGGEGQTFRGGACNTLCVSSILLMFRTRSEFSMITSSSRLHPIPDWLNKFANLVSTETAVYTC